MPQATVEGGRQLSLGPLRILLPEEAKQVTAGVRDVQGPETLHVLLVKAEKTSAAREVVVNDIEDLSLDTWYKPRPDDRVSTVLDKGEGDSVLSPKMEKKTEGSDSHTPSYRRVARPVHVAWSHDHVRKSIPAAVFLDEGILFQLRERIGIRSKRGLQLHRAGFIKESSSRLRSIGVHGKRANGHETLAPLGSANRVEKISGRDDRVHERVGNGLLAPCGSEVIDEGNITQCGGTIVGRQQIAAEDLNLRLACQIPGDALKGSGVAGGTKQATYVPKTERSEAFDYTNADEASCPGHQNPVVLINYYWIELLRRDDALIRQHKAP
jgi:hypothetical protein